MGDKIKPNWGRDAGWGGVVPMPSDVMQNSVREILQLTDERLGQYLEEASMILWNYAYLKHKQDIDGDLPKQTKGKVKQAAVDIKKTTQELSAMLFGAAGGLQPYLDWTVSLPLRGNGNMIFLEEFTRLLQGIENGCDYYLDEIYPNLSKDRPPRIKEILALEVMEHYRSFVGEQPTTTLSLDDGRKSKYTLLLQTYFLEADADIPSDGDLKKIMSWALNNIKA